jgi:1-deoxy-D-xylulose-5-phosphate synthase
MPVLDQINSPADLKKLSPEALPELSRELRNFLIETILHSGGHFAGNLGVVELSVALHYVLNSPEEPIIWDVGHQAYVHKILTGRKDLLSRIRQTQGISGFPKRGENIHDVFGTGHSSTAISAALGFAVAQQGQDPRERIYTAVVGDGALTGGMAFEALNHAALSNTRLLVVVNDNSIGIDPNTGAMNQMLGNMKQGRPNWFTEMGFHYSGPVDGHDVVSLVQTLVGLRHAAFPHVLHVKTIKGKGYEPAEKEQTRWHSTAAYVKLEPADKQPLKQAPKYQDVFGETLCELAALDERVCGVTPAMPSGSGMRKAMDLYPNRFWDVGIAEQHSVTFSAALALAGKIPFCSVYSTFLQRAYDQIIHDVALQQAPVIFCVDRAGLVGEDGPTHHGSFDLAFLQPIPGVVIAAPKDEEELRALMYTAMQDRNGPWFIRYPKGHGTGIACDTALRRIPLGTGSLLHQGTRIALLTIGTTTAAAQAAALASGLNPTVAHMRFLKPLDTALLKAIMDQHEILITVEDGSIIGGFGAAVSSFAAQEQWHGQIMKLGIPDDFPAHGHNDDLQKEAGYDTAGILNALMRFA